MTSFEKKRGRVQIIASILVLLIVIASIKFFIQNRHRKVSTTQQIAHAEAVEQTIEPEPVQVPQTQPEAPVEPVQAPQEQSAPQTVNQAEANVTLNLVGCEHYRSLVSQYNWDVNIALAIMKAESGCNPQAFNPEWHRGCQGSRGLFQIACVHHDSTFDPAGNVAAAYRIYSSSGWNPWGAFNNKSYLRYL